MKTEFSLKTITLTLQTVLPSDQDYIALHEPCFNGNVWIYVKDCVDSG